jgi:hypothetical protein
VHKTTLADYEMKYGAPPDDDLDDIAADESTNEDIAEPQQQPDQDVWRQPVNIDTTKKSKQSIL